MILRLHKGRYFRAELHCYQMDVILQLPLVFGVFAQLIRIRLC